MTTIKKTDLEDCFLLVIRDDKEHRAQLPIVRRHFRSVRNVCFELADRHVDIFFSGVFVASKKKGARKIIMDKDFHEVATSDLVYEVGA